MSLILKEKYEIDEMGINISRLKKLQPKGYLTKRIEATKKESGVSSKVRELSNEFKLIIDQIKNIQYSDLIVNVYVENLDITKFKINFPKQIEKSLLNIHNRLVKLDNSTSKSILASQDNRIQGFFDEGADPEIIIHIENDRNRTHFPNGLKDWLLGLGLGLKIYRKLLSHLKFMQSEDNASDSVQKIYTELIQRPDINCAVTKENVLLIERNVDRLEKANIVAEFIYELVISRRTSRNKKIVLDRDIILDSNLLGQLGRKKVEELIDKIINYEKSGEEKIPFQSHGEFGSEDEKES